MGRLLNHARPAALAVLDSVVEETGVKFALVLVGDGNILSIQEAHHAAGKEEKIAPSLLGVLHQLLDRRMSRVNHDPAPIGRQGNWVLVVLLIDIDLLGEVPKLLPRLSQYFSDLDDVVTHLLKKFSAQFTHSGRRFLPVSRTPGR